MTRVLLSAGDASGDVHGAALVRELRALVPDARFLGLGGAEMEKAGVEIVVPQSELAIGGLVEVVGSVRRVIRAQRRLAAALRSARPELVLLIDSSGFYLPFARRARRAGVPVLYYVAPQVWAWRRGRVAKLARRVDRVAVIHPFELEVYADAPVRVDFVGHPLVDSMGRVAAQMDSAAARSALGLDRDARVMALLPGSRRNELRYNLRCYLDTARLVHARDPRVHFVLALPSSLADAAARAMSRKTERPPLPRLHVVHGRTPEVLCACDVALIKPGTATLEAALLGRPFAVAGRANPVSVALARRLVRVPSFTMPNLIAGAPIVPEFLQEAAQPERVADSLAQLFTGPARKLQLERFRRVRDRLGPGGASRRAAAIAREMLDASA